MNTFLEQIMDDAISHLGLALAPEPEFLKNAMRQLPPAPYGMLEVRLEPGDSQVDFSQGFRERDYSLIAPWLRQSGDLHWSTLGSFVNALTSKGSLLNKSVAGVGLEFDLDSRASKSPPLPNLFFILQRSPTKSRSKLVKVLSTVLATLFDERTCKTLLGTSTNLIDNLPPGSRIKTVGIMLARDMRTLRLQIEGVPSEKIPEIMQQVQGTKLASLLGDTLSLTHRINLPSFTCLDLAPNLIPRLGLEFNDIGKRPPETLSGTLDLLIDRQLCCVKKRAALENWAGINIPSSAPVEWISNQLNESYVEGKRYFVSIKRRVSHIKLMVSEDQGLAAKAYLEFYPVIETLN